MKKKKAIIAVLVIAFITSYILCGTGQNDAGIDSIKLEEYTAVLGNRISLDSIAGTYNCVLPPNVETTLTLNADGTYLLIQAYKEKQNEREKLRGTFQILDGNILMLVHPASAKNGAKPPTKNGDTRSLFYHPVLVGGKDTIFSVLNCHN